jgi:hypothetical protein
VPLTLPNAASNSSPFTLVHVPYPRPSLLRVSKVFSHEYKDIKDFRCPKIILGAHPFDLINTRGATQEPFSVCKSIDESLRRAKELTLQVKIADEWSRREGQSLLIKGPNATL